MQLAVDLTRSIPPVPEGLGKALQEALAVLASREDSSAAFRTSSAGGTEADRVAGSKWLAPRFGETVPADRVLLTNGTQSAMLMLLKHVMRPGQVLVTERLSYGVLRDVAALAGVPMIGADIDHDGLVPESVELICRSHVVGALYCNPTFHNPTTSIMSEARRSKLAAVSRRHGFSILEDDPIGRLFQGLARPIAALAPDTTWHICGLTKCIAQGMRLAYVVAPTAEHAARFTTAHFRLSNWVSAPVMGALATQLINSGVAERIAAAIADECLAREAIAREALAKHPIWTQRGSLHVWVPVHGHDQHELTQEAASAGVLVRPAAMFAVDAQPVPDAIRLSLSSPLVRSDVERGVRAFAQLL